MNTQTHIIMGAVLFGKPAPRFAVAGALGGLIPDLPMFTIIAGLRMAGYPLSDIFGRIYWEHWWQVSNAIGHSFLLWGIILTICFIAKNRTWSGIGLAVSGSALIHSMIDFLCHRNDGHMHFWPLSQWRFQSPVSYWDANHYGLQFSLFEAASGFALAIVLWQRYGKWPVRIVLAICMAAYVAVPAFFILGND